MSREGTVRNDKPFDLRAFMCCCNQNQVEALHTFRGHEHTPGCNSMRGRSRQLPAPAPQMLARICTTKCASQGRRCETSAARGAGQPPTLTGKKKRVRSSRIHCRRRCASAAWQNGTACPQPTERMSSATACAAMCMYGVVVLHEAVRTIGRMGNTNAQHHTG